MLNISRSYLSAKNAKDEQINVNPSFRPPEVAD